MSALTEEEKLEIVKVLIDDVPVTDTQIIVYLAIAGQRIFDAAYPYGARPDEFPSEYELLQCELAVRMIARRGGEGETQHSENGITRVYADTDDRDLLSRIVPRAGLVSC